jgi:tetratricopeptide (TPR) repeat protein
MADVQRASDLYANALAMAERGDLADAVPALVRCLELDPRNADAARKLAETAHSLVRESLRLAEESLARNDRAEAARRIETAWVNCVYAPDLVGEVVAARKKAVQGMLRCARDAEVEDALGILSVLLTLDATNAEARELLGRLEDEVTDRLLREADGALTSGHSSEAVRLLEQAYNRAPSDAVREKLSRARCDEALAEGLALYEAGKYPQAIGQFRKVLGIDPGNAEAQKHLDYAEKLSQDDTLSDRFTRLE